MIYASIFGNIKNPFEFFGATGYACDINQAGCNNFGLILFLNNILKFIIIIAGIFAFIQILLAGFQYISAGNDPKAISNASNKIWQAILGLTIVAGSFVLAVIFGYLIFGDATAILSPKIVGPSVP